MRLKSVSCKRQQQQQQQQQKKKNKKKLIKFYDLFRKVSSSFSIQIKHFFKNFGKFTAHLQFTQGIKKLKAKSKS